MKTSHSSGFAGRAVYNGDMVCGGSSFPFIMGATFSRDSSIIYLYGIAGDLLFRAHQVEGDTVPYLFRYDESAAVDQRFSERVRFVMEGLGRNLSIRGLLTGKLPFAGREGNLFVAGSGYRYKGEGFSVASDGDMRLKKAKYRLKDFTVRLKYFYGDGNYHVPSSVEMKLRGCTLTIDVERLYEEELHEG
ncbi:MAG: hypothetical protein GTN70_12625 [Deltaproteobacteria bacterium]|nr:hypothetical protein [Deltaproteobacteria bacterium]NIS78615.1 hypothetical protein [Deltaproteobacteria bacterium]